MTAVAAYAAQPYAELSMGLRPRLSAAAATPLHSNPGRAPGDCLFIIGSGRFGRNTLEFLKQHRIAFDPRYLFETEHQG